MFSRPSWAPGEWCPNLLLEAVLRKETRSDRVKKNAGYLRDGRRFCAASNHSKQVPLTALAFPELRWLPAPQARWPLLREQPQD